MYLFLPRTLCALKRIVARDEHSRFGATTGVLIEAVGDAMYTATATNGKQLLSVQGMCPEKTPHWNAMQAATDEALETVLSIADFEKAFRVGDEYLRKEFAVVGLATKGDSIYLGIGDDMLHVRAVSGRFPKWRQVMPKGNPLYSVRLDPKMVADTMLALHDMGMESVVLFYYGDGATLGLRASSEDHLIEGALVPLVPSQRPEKTIPEKREPNEPDPAQDPDPEEYDPDECEQPEDDPEYLERLRQAVMIAKPDLSAENLRDAYDNITDCIDYLTELGVTIPDRYPVDTIEFRITDNPIMKQYASIKEQHPGMILAFRMGDFYEFFAEDAEIVAKELNLTLTTRDKTVAMCGFPHHSLEAHLKALLAAGHKVAICDEDPSTIPMTPKKRGRKKKEKCDSPS